MDRDRLENLVASFIEEFEQSFDTVELVQLHCIYGFLKRLVTPAINNFLWHNHHLSELNLIEHWASDDQVSVHVFAGLQNAYNIWAAFKNRNMAALSRLIQAPNTERWGSNFINKRHDASFYNVLTAKLDTKHSSSVDVTKSKIAIHDTDESPRHECLAVASSIYELSEQRPERLRHELERLSPHRYWGFVMWDYWRPDMMGFFGQPYTSQCFSRPPCVTA